ncbi:MAG: ATP-binding cassette domain-containing protein [Dehalococcoidia bacterium]
MTEEVIVLEQVFKNYGKITALSGLNLRVANGEILGLVGPNGAGKTTALRIMSTLLKPDSGVVQVCGIDAQTESNKVKRSIGYLPDLPLLYESLTVFETLKIFARAWSLQFNKTMGLKLLDEYGLTAVWNRRVKTLSRGQKQRLSLLCAVLHEPRILLFDEPFTGLDIETRRFLREKVAEFEQAGKTIVISSDDLGDVENLCHTIAMITQGKILAQTQLSHEIPPLTKREEEVIKLLAQSKSNKEIAKELYVSEETVKSHIKSIFRKLGIKSRAEAASYLRQRD